MNMYVKSRRYSSLLTILEGKGQGIIMCNQCVKSLVAKLSDIVKVYKTVLSLIFLIKSFRGFCNGNTLRLCSVYRIAHIIVYKPIYLISMCITE